MIGQANRLGEQLIADGVITPEQLAEALAKQQSTGRRLGVSLLDMGALSTNSLVHGLSKRLGVQACVLRHGLIDPKVARCIPREEAERLMVLPLFRVRGELTVAMTEPQSVPILDRLASLTGCQVRPVLALEGNLAEYQRKYLAAEVTVDAFLASIEESDVRITETEAVDEGPVTDLDKMVDGSPVVNLVNLAVLTALRDGASDIHIEPDRNATHVRYRIDGRLRELLAPPRGMHAAIVSRIKVIGRMDISERRLPQEGRVHLVAEGREIDLRVSSMPTILGEKIVIRLLDKGNLNLDLSVLGMSPLDQKQVESMLRSPHGLVLVTGPTGSGKTTTLYSALDLLRGEEVNIVTVEDPVEYQLPQVNQVQVSEGVGLTFARTLRSILRQDPDVIMVGEIRDEETARVAVQAALTGHVVLSTLHTNDCPGGVARLLDMNIEPYLLSSAVLGFVAQRLARTICKACKASYYPAPTLLESVGWGHRTHELFQKGEGCRQCHNTGFRGRTGIYEVMILDAGIKRLINDGAQEGDLRDYLHRKGWRSLRDKALDVVERGDSMLEEVLRVTRTEGAEMPDLRPAAPAAVAAEKPDNTAKEPVAGVLARD